jgi:hypothetical protein
MNFIDRRHEAPYELTQGAIAEIEPATEEPRKAANPHQDSAREIIRGKPFTEADVRALRQFPDEQISPTRVVLRKGDEVLPEIALVYFQANEALPPEAFPEMALVVPWAEKPTWTLWPAVGGGFGLRFEDWEHETHATIEEALEMIGQLINDACSGP